MSPVLYSEVMYLTSLAFHVWSSGLISSSTLMLAIWSSGDKDDARWVSLFGMDASLKMLVDLPSSITHNPSRFIISFPSTTLDQIHDALDPLVVQRKFPSCKYIPRRTRTHRVCGSIVSLPTF